jgi:hypothetical protein
MKVYLVGRNDVEFTETEYVCLSKESALKRWEEIRQDLIEQNKRLLEAYPDDKTSLKISKNLRETDPNKMNNYPQMEPFISEMETED